jgi:lipopolysaccharide export LptBFGC system permease protein LptF
MMMDTPNLDAQGDLRQRRANRRTALVLLSIALVFFVGIFASRLAGDETVGMGVIGGAVLLFLVVAIGRNLRPGNDGAAAGKTVRRPPG